MKKVLLGTSALIAAAAISAPAMAQEQIQLGIGGKMEQYFGVVDMDEATTEDRTTTGIDTDVEVYFTGATTLDNGLTVGAVIQLGGEANAVEGAGDADEQYAYIEGAFGRIMAGEKDGVSSQLAHFAPTVGIDNGDVTAWTHSFNDVNTVGGDAYTTNSADIPSISYITPTLAGFSAGVSYMQPGARLLDQNVSTHDRWEASIAYNGEFSGIGIGADVGYNTTSNVDGTLDDDMDAWRAGLVVAYAGFQVGGAYMDLDGVGATDNDRQAWTAGVAYETGPYGVSLTYVKLDSDNHAALNGPTTSEDDYQHIHLGGAYTMGPGIKAIGSVFWADAETDVLNTTVGDVDSDGTGAIVGLMLSF